MTVGTGLYLPARAKLNLVLRIVGRRADGYHLLETLFHALALHDDLWLARAERGIALRVTADDAALTVAPGPDNLVVRALTRRHRRDDPVRREIDEAGRRGRLVRDDQRAGRNLRGQRRGGGLSEAQDGEHRQPA